MKSLWLPVFAFALLAFHGVDTSAPLQAGGKGKNEGVLVEKHPKVVLLFDVSASMTTVDQAAETAKPSAALSRQDKIIAFLSDAKTAFVDKILEKASITAYRFGAGLDDIDVAHLTRGKTWTKDEWTRWLKPERKTFKLPDPKIKLHPQMLFDRLANGTNIAGSALEMLAMETGEFVQAVVIFSDGASNLGKAEQLKLLLERTSRNNVPLFTVGIGDVKHPARIRIDDLQVPETAWPDDKIAVRVPVVGTGLSEEAFELALDAQRVRDISGRPLAKEKKHLLDTRRGKFKGPGDHARSVVDFTVHLGELLRIDPAKDEDKRLEGTWRFTARVPRHPREIFAAPEHVSEPVEVVVQKRKPRVLLVGAGPSREFQFVRSLLYRETQAKRLDHSFYLQTPDDRVSDVIEGTLNRFPEKMTSDDPKDKRATLSEYDVIIAVDVDWTKFEEKQLKLIKDWVGNHGGGLVFVAGPVHTYHLARPGGFDLSAIRALCPVVLKDNRLHALNVDNDPSRPYHLEFGRAAKLFEFLKLDPAAEDPLAAWNAFFWRNGEKKDRPERGFYNYYPVERLRPDSNVLATFIGPRSSRINGGADPQPFIVHMRYGSGQTLWLGSSETWRLRTYKEEFHERFWVGLARQFCSAGPARNRHGHVLLNRVARPGLVPFEVQVLGKNLLPLPADQKLTAEVHSLNDSVKPLSLSLKAKPVQEEWKGWFVGAVQLSEPGDYEFRVAVPGTTALLTHRLTVRQLSPEGDDVRANMTNLFHLASPAAPLLKRLPAETRADVMRLLIAPEREEKRLSFVLRDAGAIPSCLQKLPALQVRIMDKPPAKKEVDPLAKSKKFVEDRLKPSEKVKVLLIDGEGAAGRKEGGDSCFVNIVLISIPGASHIVTHGDELSGGAAVKALERDDLAQYNCIFLLNVPELSDKQRDNLEKYAKAGGGVAFFLGPRVNGAAYTRTLYRDGKGLFPASVPKTFFPEAALQPLKRDFTGREQLLLRDDLFPKREKYPIFGAIFPTGQQAALLKDVPIHRYFRVPRSEWQTEGKVHELATLPNEKEAKSYQVVILKLFGELARLSEGKALGAFRPAILRHARRVEDLVSPTSERKAHDLAKAIEEALLDEGKNNEPGLAKLWASADPKVRAAYQGLVELRKELLFGDPLVVAREFGKGRVVAVMTTAGKEWNAWCTQALYLPFVWETVNYVTRKEPVPPEEESSQEEPSQEEPSQAERSQAESLPVDGPPQFLNVDLGAHLRAVRAPGKLDRVRLVTPDVSIPLQGTVRAGAGLAKAEWIVQVQAIEFELNAAPTKDKKVRNELKAVELRIPLEALSVARQQQALKEFHRAILAGQAKDSEPRPVSLTHFSLAEVRFDFARHLRALKAGEKKAQPHFLVKLALSVTDDRKVDPVTRATQPFLFLVVTENELLTQVALEETALGERLEKAALRLRDAGQIIQDQMARLGDKEFALELIALSVERAQGTLLDSANVLTEAHRDYLRIHREMVDNRVKADRLKDIRGKVVEPLAALTGGLDKARTAVQDLHARIEAEARDKKRNPATLLQAQAARREIDALTRGVDSVLHAVDEAASWSRLVEILVQIERQQRQTTKNLETLQKQSLDNLLKELLKK